MDAPEKQPWTEAAIVIGWEPLSFAQAMALRVAVGAFLMQLEDPAHREALGPVAIGYEARLLEVQSMIHKSLHTAGVREEPKSEPAGRG